MGCDADSILIMWLFKLVFFKKDFVEYLQRKSCVLTYVY